MRGILLANATVATWARLRDARLASQVLRAEVCFVLCTARNALPARRAFAAPRQFLSLSSNCEPETMSGARCQNSYNSVPRHCSLSPLGLPNPVLPCSGCRVTLCNQSTAVLGLEGRAETGCNGEAPSCMSSDILLHSSFQARSSRTRTKIDGVLRKLFVQGAHSVLC